MTDAMTDARLTLAESRIDELEADARGSLDEKSRIDRHVEALRKAHASARAAAQAAGSRFEDALEELGTRLRIAEHRRAAEVAPTRDDFVFSVEAELNAWDSYLDQLQKRTEAQTQGGPAEDSTSELRSRRNEVARRLKDARTAPDDVWRERRESVLQALDDLDDAARTA
jgi:chromosome segregation ATPase